jgi:DNA-binding NtrC family response regulator
VRIERAIVPPGTLVTLGGSTIRFDDAIRTQVPLATQAASFSGMIARSPAMLRLFADIDRVAASATSVLVVGESGTGKERVAEAVHARSARAGAPLVTIDAGALASTLLASELFGHERGAFTGADRTYPGAFERAGAGTVFLDEIGELPTADQASLLGVLERKRFRRVGGTAEVELGARVIAATNRDLRAEVNTGRFRHDLYHRLAVVVLRIPPLRERPEDVMPLVEHFAREHGADGTPSALFGDDTLARWQRHPWPGNVRELRNAIERATILCPPGEAIGLEHLPPLDEELDPDDGSLGTLERTYLERSLRAHAWNVLRTARALGITRGVLYRKIEKYGLIPPA